MSFDSNEVKLMFQFIPEKAIAEAAELVAHEEGDNNNNFNRLLREAQLYRQAALTPVYLYDNKTGQIGVTTLQCIHKKYH
jgi:hypothetical protein